MHALRAKSIMEIIAIVFFLLFAVHDVVGLAAESSQDLRNRYRFSRMLDDGGQYWLHWSFDDENIFFAVNVETTGWVGFGLSPNGQMPQSDVVIGWVDGNGTAYFHVSPS